MSKRKSASKEMKIKRDNKQSKLRPSRGIYLSGTAVLPNHIKNCWSSPAPTNYICLCPSPTHWLVLNHPDRFYAGQMMRQKGNLRPKDAAVTHLTKVTFPESDLQPTRVFMKVCFVGRGVRIDNFIHMVKKWMASHSQVLVVQSSPRTKQIHGSWVVPSTVALYLLVGGWTNPIEKYARQIGAFPQFSGWK